MPTISEMKTQVFLLQQWVATLETQVQDLQAVIEALRDEKRDA